VLDLSWPIEEAWAMQHNTNTQASETDKASLSEKLGSKRPSTSDTSVGDGPEGYPIRSYLLSSDHHSLYKKKFMYHRDCTP
jgi:hypothetical protein